MTSKNIFLLFLLIILIIIHYKNYFLIRENLKTFPSIVESIKTVNNTIEDTTSQLETAKKKLNTDI